jgi:radical SAM PhpK family P-methyltransferase
MFSLPRLDCVLIGYNETPFEQYESLLRQYGEDTEAYRDLKFSFVGAGGRKMTYAGLLNYVWNRAQGARAPSCKEPFKSGDIPNLAAAYLTHYLKKRGHQADYINLFQDERERLAELLGRDPLVVAITTTFYILNFPVSEMVRFIHDCNPNVKVVVGGPLIANHARNYGEEDLATALDDLGADIYVREPQGEWTLERIVSTLKGGGDLADVPNLIYRREGRYHRTAVQPENNDMDENAIDWRSLAGRDMGPTLQTRTARSCAFSCAFCNYPTRAGKLALAGLDTLEREFESMKSLGDVKNLVFIDDTFNVPLNRFKDICRLMIDRQYGFDWYSYFRCSNTDNETFDLMAESGCKGVFLGIESGSPRILKNMNKAATVEKYRDGVSRLRERGILTFGSFIIGFPGETAETVEETIEFIRTTGFDYYRAQLWYNEPGTPIHQQSDRYEITGDGFVWSHMGMNSMEAMDHIERMFLTIDEAVWLPQWSFDFWIIPYFTGKGVSLEQFRQQMRLAYRLLALEIAVVSREERDALREEILQEMVRNARTWITTAAPGREEEGPVPPLPSTAGPLWSPLSAAPRDAEAVKL